MGAGQGFCPAPDFDPSHSLFDDETRKVEHLVVVYLHSPDAADEELGVPRPEVPRETVRIVDCAEKEERPEVESAPSADDVLDALVLIEGQPQRPFDPVDLQVVRHSVVHDLRRIGEAKPVDSGAKIDDNIQDAVEEFNGEEIAVACLATAVDDQSMRLDCFDEEFDGTTAFCVPEGKTDVGVVLHEGNRSRFDGGSGVRASGDGVDVAKDLNVGGSWLDEGGVNEIDVTRQRIAGENYLKNDKCTTD